MIHCNDNVISKMYVLASCSHPRVPQLLIPGAFERHAPRVPAFGPHSTAWKALASVAARHLLGSCLASAAIGLRVAGAGASPVQIGRLRGAVGHRVLMPASRGTRDLHPYGRVLLSNLGTARGKK